MFRPSYASPALFSVTVAIVLTAFAANSLLNRMAFEYAGALIDPVSFALIRVISGAVMLAVLLAIREQSFPKLKRPNLVAIVGLVTYLLGFSFAYLSLDTGFGALLLFGVVQLTMFGWVVFKRQSPSALRWLGMLVAFAGLLVLLAPSGDETVHLPSALFMVLAGVGWGAYSLIGARASDALAATASNFLYAAIAVTLFTALWRIGFKANFVILPQGVVFALLSGVFASGCGYALWYAVLPRLGATRAALSQLTVPVIATAMAVVILDEVVGLRFVLATALVLVGVGLGLLRR